MTKLIILDAGHGGSDPGSIGNGLKKTITLAVVNKIVVYPKAIMALNASLPAPVMIPCNFQSAPAKQTPGMLIALYLYT